ncbi:MAG: ABC transporter permease subunit [Sporomusaceae bacterium]|nr:ABC transporter permease subunit [Sporomusaceae bacterium]
MAFFSVNVPKSRFRLTDAAVLVVTFMIFYFTIRLGAGMNAPFIPETAGTISLDPAMLPYYAGRSLLRMFIAFGASLIFALVYGYVAAKNSLAEKILIPLLDILQSIPVLGFLSATITAFIALFPGSLLGVELASILAIFTGQAWNMTFSFYNSLVTIPKDLQEASRIFHLNWWQRFVKLEVPFAMIGLVWNSMMSFGGGWFFLAASEAISVLGQNIRLPGVGSYLATAIETGDVTAIFYSIITMVLMILLVDQLFWRPLIVWSQRFKIEMTQSSDAPTSFVYDVLYRSFVVAFLVKYLLRPIGHFFHRTMNKVADLSEDSSRYMGGWGQGSAFSKVIKSVLALLFLFWLYGPIQEVVTIAAAFDQGELLEIVKLGLFTLGRVLIAVLLGVLWTVPVGVWIGLNPKVAKVFQPIVQIASSFPANMLFPFITVFFLRYHIDFEWGSIALMMLGTQWYILFNVIAGAMAIPNDLLEAGSVFKLNGWRKWRTLIIPCIFPYLITGIINASGGAWNASIVSEIVNWHDTTLAATGLGAYISEVTDKGDWGGILWGIAVMCLLVTIVNRLVWRRLYNMAETKYRLD